VVLYAGAASPGVAAEWGRLVERLLAKRAAICFAPPEVAKALNLRLSAAGVAVEQAPTTGSQVAQLREKLDLTQEQMAQAVGVTGRTIQNWESQGPSAQAERRLRDLVELWETLHRYFRPEDIPTWLNAENDAFGSPPLKLVVAGRARDVLIEFRRMQSGEPM
jgi:DNA-binding transcriptional regulator YiaG